MWDGQARSIDGCASYDQKVDIDRPRPPTLSPDPPKICLDCLGPRQKPLRIEVGVDEHDGVQVVGLVDVADRRRLVEGRGNRTVTEAEETPRRFDDVEPTVADVGAEAERCALDQARVRGMTERASGPSGRPRISCTAAVATIGSAIIPQNTRYPARMPATASSIVSR